MMTKEQKAGELYVDGAKAVRGGGHELRMLASHMVLMINGTPQHKGPLWVVRELPDGRVIQLDRFIDYLLKPTREGLGLPSLYFLKQALEATPQDGEEALGVVRRELAKEHVDLDAQAKRDEMKMHGERKALAKHGVIGGGHGRVDNIKSDTKGGTSASYLAGVLKRDHPEISGQLAEGKFKSVRAAAIAAGIITPPTPFEIIVKQLPKLTPDERARLRSLL